MSHTNNDKETTNTMNPHYKNLDQCVEAEMFVGPAGSDGIGTPDPSATFQYCMTLMNPIKLPTKAEQRAQTKAYDEMIDAIPTPAATPFTGTVNINQQIRSIIEPEPIPVRIVNPEAITQPQTQAYIQQPEPVAPATTFHTEHYFIPIGLIAVLVIGVIRGIIRRSK